MKVIANKNKNKMKILPIVCLKCKMIVWTQNWKKINEKNERGGLISKLRPPILWDSFLQILEKITTLSIEKRNFLKTLWRYLDEYKNWVKYYILIK